MLEEMNDLKHVEKGQDRHEMAPLLFKIELKLSQGRQMVDAMFRIMQ